MGNLTRVILMVPKDLKNTKRDAYGFIGHAVWYGSKEQVDRILGAVWLRGSGVKTRRQLKKYLERKSQDYKIRADQYKRNKEKYGATTFQDWIGRQGIL